MKDGNLLRRKEQDTEEHWISISDMMAGLMVIFLFIAIIYMLHVAKKYEIIELIVEPYQNLKRDLPNELEKEFLPYLKRWNAELNEDTLTMRFKVEGPRVLFDRGEIVITTNFKDILDEFFPLYIKILTKPKYKDDVEEIRIEGHTSSEWWKQKEQKDSDEAYILNMGLSQGRARSVLKYVLYDGGRSIQDNVEIQDNKEWIKSKLTANGLSSSKLIFKPNCDEDRIASRRVEFRVQTKADKLIEEIADQLKKQMKKLGEQE